MKKVVWIGAVIILLSGCGNKHIDVVKNSRLELDPTYTIEQIFDNRNLCSDVDWFEFTGKKGRPIVEYNCEIKGAKIYLDSVLEQKIQDVTDTYKRNKNTYHSQVTDLKNTISRYQKYSEDIESQLQPDGIKELHKQSIKRNSKAMAELKVQLEKAHEVPERLKRFKTELETSAPQSQELNQLRGDLQEKYDQDMAYFEHRKLERIAYINTRIEILEEDLQRTIDKKKGSLKSSYELVDSTQKELSILNEKITEAFQKYDEEEAKKLDALYRKPKLTGAIEVFQWAVITPDKIEFISSSSGIKYTLNEGDDKFEKHGDLGAILSTIYRNDPEHYRGYIKQVGSDIWTQILTEAM